MKKSPTLELRGLPAWGPLKFLCLNLNRWSPEGAIIRERFVVYARQRRGVTALEKVVAP